MPKSPRRSFSAASVPAAERIALPFGSPLPPGRTRPGTPSDHVGMGLIGAGNRGTQLLRIIIQQSDVDIVGFCDVHEPHGLRRDAERPTGSRPANYLLHYAYRQPWTLS